MKPLITLMSLLALAMPVRGEVEAPNPYAMPAAATTSAVDSSPVSDWEDEDASPRERVPVSRVLAQLRRDIAASWKAGESLPPLTQPLADRWHAVADGEELVRAMSQRLHHDPAVDARMKRELLRLGPALDEVDGPRLARLVSALPGIRRAAGPGARPLQDADGNGNRRRTVSTPGVDPELSVVNDGTLLDITAHVNPSDPRYVTTTVRADNTNLVQLRQISVNRVGGTVNPDNGEALNFRNELILRLPRAGGARALAMLRDAADRLEAGDSTLMDTAGALADEVEALAANDDAIRAIDAATLSQMQGLRDALASQEVGRLKDDRMVRHPEIDWLRFPDAALARVDAALVTLSGECDERAEVEATATQPTR